MSQDNSTPVRRRVDDLILQRLDQMGIALNELKQDVRQTLADHEARLRANEAILQAASPVARIAAVEQEVAELKEYRASMKYWMAGGAVGGSGLGALVTYALNFLQHKGP